MANRNADPLVEFFGEQITVPANNGVRRAYNIPPRASRILLEPTAAMRYQWTPAIRQVWFFDASLGFNHQWVNLAKEVYSDYHRTRVPTLINGARNASAAYPASTGGVLNSMTASDFIYVGVTAPIGGLWLEVSGANDQDQAPSVGYSGNGGFTDIGTVTDNTSSSVTLDQDGAMTWTVPVKGSAWIAKKLAEVTDLKNVPREANVYPLYWLRLSFDGTLGTATQLDNMAALHANAMGGAEANEGGIIVKADVEYTQDFPMHTNIPSEVGAIEILAQAGSGTTAQVSWLRRP